MRIEQLIKTLKREFYKVNFLQSTLDSVILFLILNTLQIFVQLPLPTALADYKVIAAFSGIFLLLNFFYRSRNYNIEIYENENPELNELLRTAKDNVDKNNTASRALFNEIKEISRNVSSESIIPNNQILGKTLLIGVLSIGVVMTGTIDTELNSETLETLWDEPDEETTENTSEFDYELLDGEEILGDHNELNPEDMDINYDTSPQEDTAQTAPFASQQEVDSLQQFEEDPSFELSKEYLQRIRED